MEEAMEKRKPLRRASVQFYLTAEEHIRNEVNHERHLTETSRLTSSWANLRLSSSDKPDFSDHGFSSPGSSGSSPVGHRPNSFSGPLMISVTCSSSSAAPAPPVTETKPSVATTNAPVVSTFSRSASCYPSPVASPVSSRVQCYSPGTGLPSTFTAKKRTASVSSGGSASPLILAGCRGKKRTYNCMQNTDFTSSTEVSRESSPESLSAFSRRSKFPRSVESGPRVAGIPAIPQFRSPSRESSRCTPPVSTPSSPVPRSSVSSSMGVCNSALTTSLPSLAPLASNSPRPPALSDFSQREIKSCSPSSFSCPESAVSVKSPESSK